MQGKHLLTLFCACLGALLCGCHSSRKATSSSQKEKQQFISNATIDPHRNASAATASKTKPKPAPLRSQPTAKPVVSPTEATEIKKRYAALLSVKPKDLGNIYLYKFIDHWYGLDYKYGGTKKTGIDCSAFAQKLYSEVYGINLVRTAMEQFNNCQLVKAGGTQEGDLVFFHIDSKRITHVGIYLTNNFFVHSSSSGGVAISNLNESYWHKYYAGAGRVPKG